MVQDQGRKNVLYYIAAVDTEHLPGDEIRLRTAQKGCRMGDVLRCAEPSEGRFVRKALQGVLIVAIEHRGADDAGRDAVDADAAGGDLLRKRLGKADERRLCRGVIHLTGRADLPPHRADIQDAARFLPDHRREQKAGAFDRREDVDVKQPPPGLRVDVRKQPRDGDARIVHKHVNMSDLRENAADHRLKLRIVRKIGSDGDAVRICRGFSAVLDVAVEYDRIPVRGKPACDRRTDAAAVSPENGCDCEQYTYTGDTFITVIDFFFDKSDGHLVKYTTAYSVEGRDDIVETRTVKKLEKGADTSVFNAYFADTLVNFDTMSEPQRQGFCQGLCATWGVTADEMFRLGVSSDSFGKIDYDTLFTLIHTYGKHRTPAGDSSVSGDESSGSPDESSESTEDSSESSDSTESAAESSEESSEE